MKEGQLTGLELEELKEDLTKVVNRLTDIFYRLSENGEITKDNFRNYLIESVRSNLTDLEILTHIVRDVAQSSKRLSEKY